MVVPALAVKCIILTCAHIHCSIVYIRDYSAGWGLRVYATSKSSRYECHLCDIKTHHTLCKTMMFVSVCFSLNSEHVSSSFLLHRDLC